MHGETLKKKAIVFRQYVVNIAVLRNCHKERCQNMQGYDKTGSVRERLLKICKSKLGQAANQECPRIVWEKQRPCKMKRATAVGNPRFWIARSVSQIQSNNVV